MTTCPFCQIPPERIVAANDLAFVIRDGYPISPGHTLVIPRRHVGSFFDISEAERSATLRLLGETRTGRTAGTSASTTTVDAGRD